VSLQPGALLCLFTVPFALTNSLHQELARYKQPRRWRLHVVNLATSVAFVALAFAGAGSRLGESWPALWLRLWLPIAYYWWAYAWAGNTLHLFHPPETSFDRRLIAWEQRLFRNPSLWLARGRSHWLNELMAFYYWSYYFYVPSLGIALMLDGDTRRFEAMALAICLGYAISYSAYPHFPLWGPRWALVSEGLLPEADRILPGYAISRFMNRIMWSDTAHKGGAMPSAHSATCMIFMIWAVRLWGPTGAWIAALIGGGMFISTVYGRYHYVIDVIVGIVVGLAALTLADLLLLA